MKKTKIQAADLFCGAGGTSSGLLDACRELGYGISLLAVNHWDIAIATHTANLLDARHMNADLSDVNPRSVVPGGKLRLLVASPECIHFSNARGGRPMSKQGRASVKYVLRWVTALDVQDVLIENVREFMDWGPLHRSGTQKDRPIQARKGEYFRRFVTKLQQLGYRVEWRILCAADYGDATTRKRLFIRARQGNRPIAWPEPTHAEPGKTETLFETKSAWRAAREILDLDDRGESIFNRKRPLSPNTIRRIFKGLEKFSGLPFLIPFFGEYDGKAPRTHNIDEPLPTVTSHGAGGVVQPFIVSMYGTSNAQSVDQPFPTVTAQGNHHYVTQPFVMAVRGGDDGYLRGTSINDPTQDTQNRFGLAQPFIVKFYKSLDGSVSIDEPLPTATGHERFGLCVPLTNGYAIVDIFFRMVNPLELARAHSLDDFTFRGTREEVVKQIGNSVPRRMAKALCVAALRGS